MSSEVDETTNDVTNVAQFIAHASMLDLVELQRQLFKLNISAEFGTTQLEEVAIAAP
tara:strand:- start:1535 stop:1705 length:171 start_codon:yes stop_codon:yes gene_type:complete